MLTSTHKTFYYIFLQTKADEIISNASRTKYQPTRFLVEIRDLDDPPYIDPYYPWNIKKRTTTFDIISGRLTLTHNEVFDHIFRYWSISMASLAVFGSHKMAMVIWDRTDIRNPKRFAGEDIYFERGPNDTYFLGWAEIVRDVCVKPGDEIGLFWDVGSKAFHFSIISCRN